MGKVKRSLSILLAIAMVITMMPQTAMPVYAQQPGIDDNVNGSPEADDSGTPSDPEMGTPGGEISDEGETSPEGGIPGDNDENNNNGDGADDGLDIPVDPNAGSNDPGTGDDPDADDVITIMGDIMPVADGDKTYTISFPATQTGYTLTDGNGDSLEEAEKTWTVATEGAQPYVFGLKLLEGYKDPVVTAKIDEVDVDSANITVANPGTDENAGYYKYTIKTDAVSAVDTGKTIEISISATRVYTLTVDDSAVEDIGTVKYTKSVADEPTWSEFSDNKLGDLGEDDNKVYVKFEFDSAAVPEADQGDYDIVVMKKVTGATGDGTKVGKVTGKDYYEIDIDDDYTLTVTATRTKYNVAVKVDGSAPGDSSNATVAWSPTGLVSDEGKIAANTDLKFTVTLKDNTTHKITNVAYTVGDDDTEKTPTLSKGVYTIAKGNIKDDVTIIVTTESLEKTITFAYDEEKIAKPVVSVDGKEISADKWSETVATVSELNNVTFTVVPAPNSKYKVAKVTVGDDKELKPGKNNVYTLGKLTANTTVKIDHEIDDTKAYNLTWKRPTGVSNTRAYSVKFYSISESSLGDGLDGSETYYSDKMITTVTDHFYAVVTLAKGYEFDVNDEDPEAVEKYLTVDGDNVDIALPGEDIIKGLDDGLSGGLKDNQQAFEITYSKEAYLTLTVKIKTEGLNLGDGKTQTILFSNQSVNLTYSVDLKSQAKGINKNIVKKEATSSAYSNAYEASDGATEIQFVVTCNNSAFVPEVTYLTNSDGAVMSDPLNWDVETPVKGGKTNYTYSIPVATLNDYTVIYLDATIKPQKVTITYDANDVTVIARIGAKAVDPDQPASGGDTVGQPETSGGEKTDTYSVPHGETITITGTANDNCMIDTAIQTQNGKDKSLSTNKGARFETAIKADGNASGITIKVAAKKLYRAELKVQDNEDAEPVKLDDKGNATVDYAETYELQVFHGAATDAITLDSAEVREVTGKNNIESDSVATDVTAAVETDTVTLTTKITGQNKKYIVKIYETETAKNAGQPDTAYYLTVLPTATSVALVEVKGNVITQTADTVRTYTLKPSPTTANAAMIKAEIDTADQNKGFSATAENGILTVTTPQTKVPTEGLQAKVNFYYEGAEKAKVLLTNSSLTIKSADQLAGKTPTVKLAASDDTTLTLALTAPKAVEQINKEGDVKTVYYAVTISTTDTSTVDTTKKVFGTVNADTAKGNIIGENGALGSTGIKTFYRALTEATKNETFTVNSADPGEGDAWKYKVKVQLVQAKAAITAEEDKTVTQLGDSIIATSLETKELECQTIRPWYENNLKLKKGDATTIYTGQGIITDAVTGSEANNEDAVAGAVKVAVAQFSANTTHRKLVKVEDTTYANNIDGTGGSLKLAVIGDSVYAQALESKFTKIEANDKYTAPGKHKITVYAEADNGMQGASASIDVTVVQGIEGLEVTVPSISIYKVNNKASSLKAAVAYNKNGEDVKTYAPKTKKVDWKVGDTDGSAFPSTDPRSLVTVKNGTITVAKNFVVDNKDNTKNEFYVWAVANDYTVKRPKPVESEKVKITITDIPQEVGYVVLAREKTAGDANTPDQHAEEPEGETKGKTYEVLARNSQSRTAEQLAGARLFVLKKGTPEKPEFTDADILEAKCFTFSSSNKAVIVNSDQSIKITKPVNKLKFTATANDGSKQKSVITVNIIHTPVEIVGGLALKVSGDTPHLPAAKSGIAYEGVNNTFTFEGTMGSILSLQVMKLKGGKDKADADEASWTDLTDYTDFKVSVKNAKLQTASGEVPYGDKFDLVITKSPATVTLSYKVGGKAQTVKYDIVSTSWADLKKAPKIALKKGSALIAAEKYAGEQKLEAVISAPDKKTAIKDFVKGKQVKVEVDLSAANAKTLPGYRALEKYLGKANSSFVFNINDNGEVAITLGKDDDRTTTIPAGTYKLKVTIGQWDHDNYADGSFFKPEYQPVAISVKAAAQKAVKGSFKLATSYTLSGADSWVAFNTAGSKALDEDSVEFGEFLNANVNGEINEFTKYFVPYEIDVEDDTDTYEVEGDSNQKKIIGIRLADEILEAVTDGSDPTKTDPAIIKKLSDIIPAKDLTGYVPYSASYGDPATPVSGTAKITIKLQEGKVLSYAIYKNPTVLNDREQVPAEITITANKNSVFPDIAYAAAAADTGKDDETGKGSFITKADLSNCETNGSQVILTSQSKPKVGAHKVTLYIVPEGSSLAEYIGNISVKQSSDGEAPEDTPKTKEKQLEAIIKNGIQLQATITVKDAKDTKFKKITIPNKTVVFNKSQYWKEEGSYGIKLRYSWTVDNCEIDDIQVKDVKNELYGAISFAPSLDEYYDEVIDVTLNRKALEELVGDGKTGYGKKKISVPVTVTFKQDEESPEEVTYGTDKEPEEYTFTVTLPDEASDDAKTATLDSIFTAIQNAMETDKAAVEIPNPWMWQYIDDSDKDEEDHTDLDYTLEDIFWQVVGKAESHIPAESNVGLVYPEKEDTIRKDGGGAFIAYKAATADTAGSVTVTLTLKDFEAAKAAEGGTVPGSGTAKTDEELTYTFEIPAMGTAPAGATQLQNKIKELLSDSSINKDQADSIILTNQTKAMDILNYLKANEDVQGYLGGNLKLYAENFKIAQEATDDESGDGKIYITIRIADIYYGDIDGRADVKLAFADNDALPEGVTQAAGPALKIPKLDTIDTTIGYIDTALADPEKIKATNYTTKAEIALVIDGAIKNREISWTWTEDPTVTTPPSVPGTDSNNSEGKGEITGKIKLTNEKSTLSEKSKEHPISIEIDPLKTDADVISAVKAAVIDGGENAIKAIVEKAKTASDTDSAKIRQEILDAANDAIKAEPYKVIYKTEKQGKKNVELFTFNAAKWDEKGELSFTLQIVGRDNAANVLDDEGVLTRKDDLPARPELQTLTQAQTQVKDWIAEQKAKKDGTWEGIISNDNNKDAATTAVKDALQNCISNKENITVVLTAVTFRPADLKQGVKIEFKWHLTKTGENPTTPISDEIEIKEPKKDMDLAKAEAKKAAEAVHVSDKLDENDTQNIVTAAKAAVEPNYTVRVKSGSELAVKNNQNATINETGLAKITLQVAEKEDGKEDDDNSLTWQDTDEIECVIDELAQDEGTAHKAVADAVEELEKKNNIEKPKDVETAGTAISNVLDPLLANTLKHSLYEYSITSINIETGAGKIIVNKKSGTGGVTKIGADIDFTLTWKEE